MNYDTTIPLPQEYNCGLVHLNLFELPSSVISNRVHPRGFHRIRYFGSIIIGVAELPIQLYGDLFFINSSMTLSRILHRHALQSLNSLYDCCYVLSK
jgi:hypothetical protein